MNTSQLSLDEVYDIWYTPFWQTSLYYGILSIVVLVSAMIIAFYVKNFIWYKKPLSVGEQAQKNIEALSFGVPQEFYIHLSALIKWYLASKALVHSSALTDEEMVQAVMRVDLPAEARELLKTISDHAQKAKYAHERVDLKKLKNDKQRVLDFIVLCDKYLADQAAERTNNHLN